MCIVEKIVTDLLIVWTAAQIEKIYCYFIAFFIILLITYMLDYMIPIILIKKYLKIDKKITCYIDFLDTIVDSYSSDVLLNKSSLAISLDDTRFSSFLISDGNKFK